MSVIRKILDLLIGRRVDGDGDDPHPQEESFRKSLCPDCDGGLVAGPRSGGAINVRCQRCGSIFNILIHEDRLLFVERLHYGVGARTKEELA